MSIDDFMSLPHMARVRWAGLDGCASGIFEKLDNDSYRVTWEAHGPVVGKFCDLHKMSSWLSAIEYGIPKLTWRRHHWVSQPESQFNPVGANIYVRLATGPS